MAQVKIHVYKPGTNLRRGGSVSGPDNVIMVLGPPATYVALEQCAGGTVVEGEDRNFWWVRIEVPQENDEIVTGWVSAVRIGGDDPNDKPITGVPISPTVFAPTVGSTAAPGG